MKSHSTTALTPAQKQFVGNHIIRFSDVLNSTGLYTFLKEHDAYEKGKDALTDVVIGLLNAKLNERFHTGLNFFEKMGFLSDRKLQEHGKRIAFAKGAADFVTRSLIDITPMVIDHVHRTREFQKLSDFFIAWLAYVNREPSVALQNRVVRLYKDSEREYDHQRFVSLFEESTTKRPGLLPIVPFGMREHPETLYMMMLAGCDLNNEGVLGRAHELGEYLGFNAAQIEQQVGVVLDGSAATSDLTGFAGFSFDSLFQDLALNVDHARDAAVYLVENDPYQQIRQERKKRILQGSVGLAAAAMTLVSGPVGDIVIAASAPIVLNLVSTEPSPSQVVEVHRRLPDIKKQVQAAGKKQESK